jgi:uroporphyrinogen-III synthase
VFTVTRRREDAEQLALAMRAAGFDARACRTVG